MSEAPTALREHALTVLILVPNAQDRLERCLQSVTWADDVFCVVDSKTDDGSEEIARRFTEHVVTHPYENAAAQRNWALPQIATEWTLVLDADEWISEELADEIRRIVADPGGLHGYQIKRLSYFFGKLILHCGWHRDYNLRLFRTSQGRYLDKKVVTALLEDHMRGRRNEELRLWTLLGLEVWQRTFLRGVVPRYSGPVPA